MQIVYKHDVVGPATVAVPAFAPERRHLDRPFVRDDDDRAEPGPSPDGLQKKAHNVQVWRGRGDVPVVHRTAEQHIPQAAAHKIRLVPV